MKRILIFVLFFFFISINVNAYDCEGKHHWITDIKYNQTSEEGRHTVVTYYSCNWCGEKKQESHNENCKYSGTVDESYKSNNDNKTHKRTVTKTCICCDAESKDVSVEDCYGKMDSCIYVSATKHKYYGYCNDCEQEIYDTYKHTFDWLDHEGSYKYECMDECMFAPKFNGSYAFDYDSVDNISLKKGKSTKDTLDYYKKKINPIVSIKCSKKNVCKVTKKNGTLTFSGKNKGKCKVKVRMASGALYIYNVTVK